MKLLLLGLLLLATPVQAQSSSLGRSGVIISSTNGNITAGSSTLTTSGTVLAATPNTVLTGSGTWLSATGTSGTFTCCVSCCSGGTVESEVDKTKRTLELYKDRYSALETKINISQEKENMNDAAMKIIQTYVESNGYAWGGFSFLLHCLGIAALSFVGSIVYWNVMKAKKLK